MNHADDETGVRAVVRAGGDAHGETSASEGARVGDGVGKFNLHAGGEYTDVGEGEEESAVAPTRRASVARKGKRQVRGEN